MNLLLRFKKVYCELKDMELAYPVNHDENQYLSLEAQNMGQNFFWVGYSTSYYSYLYRDLNGAIAYQIRVQK